MPVGAPRHIDTQEEADSARLDLDYLGEDRAAGPLLRSLLRFHTGQAQQAQWLLGSSGQTSAPATGRPQNTQRVVGCGSSMGGKVLLGRSRLDNASERGSLGSSPWCPTRRRRPRPPSRWCW